MTFPLRIRNNNIPSSRTGKAAGDAYAPSDVHATHLFPARKDAEGPMSELH